jgi:hypothetical protein
MRQAADRVYHLRRIDGKEEPMNAVLAAAALAALYLTSTLVGCDPARGLSMSGRQSGLTSAPIRPQAVQLIREPGERKTVSSGS